MNNFYRSFNRVYVTINSFEIYNIVFKLIQEMLYGLGLWYIKFNVLCVIKVLICNILIFIGNNFKIVFKFRILRIF